MAWEFAALWVDDPDAPWQWVWRRIADDNGAVLEESATFVNLDLCLANAREHGFEHDDCGCGD